MISLKFLGAAQEVGRSAFLLKDSNNTILLDYGVKLTPYINELMPKEDLNLREIHYPLQLNEKIDSLILSHAHLDHSGFVPNYFKQKNCFCYMTKPTLDLSRLLWFDTIKIAERQGIEPVFSKKEIEKASKFTICPEYNEEVRLSEDILMKLFDAGHILGSAITSINFNEKKIIYSGDFRLHQSELFSGAKINERECNYLIMESTYGDREHVNREKETMAFIESVQQTIDENGFVLIPAFAIGRSQEVIVKLLNYGIDADIYLDGMSKKAAKIFLNHPNFFDDFKNLKVSLEKVKWVRDNKMRKKILERKPSIIVTTAGMLSGGPVIYYLSKLYSDKRSALFFTGYQVKGTPGNELLETGFIELDDLKVKVAMKIKKFDFSAHAGKTELLNFVKQLNPDKIFLVHGDKEVMPALKKEIEASFEIPTIIPKLGDQFDLD